MANKPPRDLFSTPGATSSSGLMASTRSTARKRDTLAAELEKDPHLSTIKRQQRTQAFTSHMAHASLERQLVAAQTAKMELETKMREKDITIERLERDRRWLAEREKEEREEKERERLEHEEVKRKADQELRTLRSSLLTLREEHADLEDAHSTLSRSTSQTASSQKAQLTTMEHRVIALEEELAEYKNIAEERRRTIETLQDEVDELYANQDKSVRQDAEDENWAVLREELHRQAAYLRTLEASNAKMKLELVGLRERHASVEVLKEQNRELERKLGGAEQLKERIAQLEAELAAARREREEWASKTSRPAGPSETPISITQSLITLRLTHARLLEEHGADLALLHRREQELAEAASRQVEASEAIEQLEQHIRELKDQLGRREQRAVLAEREVEFLQALLTSFQAEQAETSAMSGSAPPDQTTSRRVQQLEGLLKEYKSTNERLQEELDTTSAHTASITSELRQQLEHDLRAEREVSVNAQNALAKAEAAVEQNLEKIDTLEQTLFELRGEIGAGRHVPPGVRILSMKENPAQQWEDLRQEVMDRLKNENEALIARLRQLEESGVRDGVSSEELVPRASWDAVNKEKADLEEVVKQREKRLLRLQEVFKTKSAEFREAIGSILGLKFAFYPNGQVRVTSQYDLSASFVFQPSSKSGGSARMQLIAQGEGGPQDLAQWMRNWVEEEQCIPGFLATVTLECYDRWKREEALSAS